MLLESKPSGIANVTLDHPPANAIGQPQIDALSRVLAQVAAESNCRVLIVRGAGRFFCAGADIRIMQGGSNESERADRLADFAHALQMVCSTLENLAIPTIAAIRGTATGGGLELAMACDFRIAAREALFGLPETKLGLIPGAGGTQRMVALIGRAHALDLILRGRLIGGDEAARIGLAHESVSAEDVEPRAMALAEELASQPREALREAKRCINLARSEAGFAAEIDATRALHRHPDTMQRIAAFLARRSTR